MPDPSTLSGWRVRLNRGAGFDAFGPGNRHPPLRKGGSVLAGLIGLLIVIAIVLFLAKVAIGGGIVGAIALIVLIWFLLNR
jgi:hypothetical protein